MSGVIVERESVWVGRDGQLADRRVVDPTARRASSGSYLVCGIDVTEQKRRRRRAARSRSRIVEAAADARRRLERNLHDGAQQRLVSLSLALRLAQARLASDPDGADQLLAGAAEELALALEELRELARGIHPAVLTDRGLAAALEALAPAGDAARSSSTPMPDERLPGPVEAAAFYVVSEALANVAKYAHASVGRGRAHSDRTAGPSSRSRTTASAAPTRRAARACAASPTGWRRSTGELEVDSREGRGTTVRAVIPLSGL